MNNIQYVIHWEYDDKSGSGVLPYIFDEKSIVILKDILDICGDNCKTFNFCTVHNVATPSVNNLRDIKVDKI